MKRARHMEKPLLPPTSDARASRRSPETLLVSYTISADLPPEYTETFDISRGGLAMLTNAALSPDLAIIIELELRNDTRPKLRLAGNVRWSTYDPSSRKYRTGVSFVDRTPEFERELERYIETLDDLRNLGTV